MWLSTVSVMFQDVDALSDEGAPNKGPKDVEKKLGRKPRQPKDEQASEKPKGKAKPKVKAKPKGKARAKATTKKKDNKETTTPEPESDKKDETPDPVAEDDTPSKATSKKPATTKAKGRGRGVLKRPAARPPVFRIYSYQYKDGTYGFKNPDAAKGEKQEILRVGLCVELSNVIFTDMNRIKTAPAR